MNNTTRTVQAITAILMAATLVIRVTFATITTTAHFAFAYQKKRGGQG